MPIYFNAVCQVAKMLPKSTVLFFTKALHAFTLNIHCEYFSTLKGAPISWCLCKSNGQDQYLALVANAINVNTLTLKY